VATIQKVIEFVDKVGKNSMEKLVYNKDTKKFVSVSAAPINYQGFTIGDPVEDILNILNRMKQRGKLTVDGVNMLYRPCVTLKDPEVLQAAFHYILQEHC
jgi:hypothetical protein